MLLKGLYHLFAFKGTETILERSCSALEPVSGITPVSDKSTFAFGAIYKGLVDCLSSGTLFMFQGVNFGPLNW